MSLSILGLVLSSRCFATSHKIRAGMPSQYAWRSPDRSRSTFISIRRRFIFDKVDVDAYSIRGAVHALMGPLLLVSTTRRSDWISQLRVSRRAAFHSATLLICGLYLIFISAVGLLRQILRRRLGPGTATGGRIPVADPTDDTRAFGNGTRQAAGFSQQEFLQVPLRLPRRMAQVHAHSCAPRTRPRNGTASDSRPGGSARESRWRLW